MYCFGAADSSPAFISSPLKQFNSTGPAVSLQVVPAEFALLAEKAKDLNFLSRFCGSPDRKTRKGFDLGKVDSTHGKVQSKVDATISQQGILTAEPDALLSAGAIKVSSGSLSGVTRGRVIPNLPYNENFEDGFRFSIRVPIKYPFHILLYLG